MDKKGKKNPEKVTSEIIKIEVKKDDLLGDYIHIDKNVFSEREGVMIKIKDKENYVIGELIITDRMRVFYNHKKRVENYCKE